MRATLLLTLPKHETLRQEFAAGAEGVRSVQEDQRWIPTTFSSNP